MKRVEAIITQMVTSRAIITLDEHDHIVEVEEIIEEEKREDTELDRLLEVVDEEDDIPDHREVER